MAYHLHYTISFQNWITENIRIELYKKDEEADSVGSLRAVSFRQSYPSGEGKKFDSIISCEVSITLRINPTDAINFYDLLVTYIDEWKVIAYSDEQVIFVGFLTPGEGTAEFQNKPYDLVLSATDGLGLLKGVELTDINGDAFGDINLLSDYIAAILYKTGCDIPIRMFSSWKESSGIGRLTTPTKDTFNQYGLHKRTFLSDKTEFFDCYESLRRISKDLLSVYQWSGMWVVLNIGEMQTNTGPPIWYTDYDSSGTVTGWGQLAELPCPVGHDLIIHPRDRSQLIGSGLPIKSAKHTYNYIPPSELVNNQDLSQLGALISPLGGPSHRAYQLVGWTKYENDLHNEVPYSGSATQPYIRVEIDAFGNEVFRYYRIERDTSAGGTLQGYIRNDNNDFWVAANDELDLSFTYRVSDTALSDRDLVIVALKKDGASGSSASDWWTLQQDGSWQNNDTRVAVKANVVTLSNKWITESVECDPFPEDGNIYILLGAGNFNNGQYVDFKAPSISYKPFFSDPIRTFAVRAFGINFIPIVLRNPNDTAPKGDYWFTQQDRAILDKVDEEVYLSDANRKSIKGALFRGTTTALTTTTWNRDNVTEERHFKELVNLSRYNHAYRRMYKTRGIFSGLKWQPANDTTIFEPLGFHRHFYFPDKSELSGKYFMLVPPLTINHDSGTFDGTFVECFDSGLVQGSTGSTAEQVANQLASLINGTSAAEWDSAGGAPSPGTAWFPPVALAVGSSLSITMNPGNNPTASTTTGGVGNSPTITLNSNIVFGTKRIVNYTVGPDIQPGNTFTISIYGHDVTFTASSVTSYQDGNQEGDTHEYQISFK